MLFPLCYYIFDRYEAKKEKKRSVWDTKKYPLTNSIGRREEAKF